MAGVTTYKRPYTLGIEGGGTHTTVLLADAQNIEIKRATFGPGNVQLLNDRQLSQLLRTISGEFEPPDFIGLGMAGSRNKKDHQRVGHAAGKVWKGTPCFATHDLEIALGKTNVTAVILVAGTGSCCFGKTSSGRTAKMGGWGHILGDKGSGFEIGLRALKAVVFYFDRNGTWSQLGESLLSATGVNEPDELIEWVSSANKSAIAALTPEVFAAAKHRDRIARDILKGAVTVLAKDAVSCAKKICNKLESVEFVLSGGVLRNQPTFAKSVRDEIKEHWPKAEVRTQNKEGVWGAIELARGLKLPPSIKYTPNRHDTSKVILPNTEKRHPRSTNLDKLPLTEAIELMLSEEVKGVKAVHKETKIISRLVRQAAKALGDGGRLFYVGAGTSGRLGVLDASECPPTFRTQPRQVQGIIAGGTRALTRSVEGAEDDMDAGGRAVQFRGVGKKDIVIGIAASGRTPFVWGALAMAKKRGAKTALVCFNQNVKRKAGVPEIILAPAIGPEILTGSTRLKAGTATKLILNSITTLTMVKLGKVTGNLMVDLDPKNEKLRKRAIQIVMTLTGVNSTRAHETLVRSKWVIKRALAKLGD